MSRNGSGTYTLPSGNPVVSGTLIEASWANTTLSDLASAMTDSLSRSGQGGMTAALRLFDGTSSVPGLAWGSETTTGWYRAGAGDMRLVVTGSEIMRYQATGVGITGTLSASGNTTVGGTLAVTGAATFSGQTVTLSNSTAFFPQLINRNTTSDANASYLVLDKIRGSSVVQNGDVLGNLVFRGFDGTQYLQGAYINAIVNAAPGTNDMPAALTFGVTADGGSGPSEQMRLTSTGLGIGTSSLINGGRLSVRDTTGNPQLSIGDAGSYVSFYTSGGALYLQPAGTTRAILDSSGNLGLGVTPSAWGSAVKALQFDYGAFSASSSVGTEVDGNCFYNGSNWIFRVNGRAYRYNQADAGHSWYNSTASGTAGNAISFTQAMTLDASGRLLVGTTSASGGISAGGLDVIDRIAVGTGSVGTPGLHCRDSTGTGVFFGTNILGFSTGSTERARIDSSGVMLIGLTSAFNGTTSPLQVSNNASNQVLSLRNQGGTPYGQYILYSGASPNNTANEFLYCSDTTAQRFSARSNGGLANYSGNNVNLSDRREKTNFAPAKSYLETICAIPVQTFNYIDQNMEEDPGLTLGVVAQDVQAVAPELVMESDWSAEKDGSKMRLSVYQTDLQYALMKALQEAVAEINQLKARLDAANL